MHDRPRSRAGEAETCGANRPGPDPISPAGSRSPIGRGTRTVVLFPSLQLGPASRADRTLERRRVNGDDQFMITSGLGGPLDLRKSWAPGALTRAPGDGAAGRVPGSVRSTRCRDPVLGTAFDFRHRLPANRHDQPLPATYSATAGRERGAAGGALSADGASGLEETPATRCVALDS